jgi:hypothetical protein
VITAAACAVLDGSQDVISMCTFLPNDGMTYATPATPPAGD